MIPRLGYTIDKSAYEIDSDVYQRFSVLKQAFVTVGREDTGQTGIVFSLEKMFKTMAQNITKNVPGKSRIDYALSAGGNALNLILGTYGMPNSQFLKWSPLYTPEFLSKNPLEADPSELTMLVKKAAALYGSDLVGITALDARWVYDSDLFKPFVFTDEGSPHETDNEFVIPRPVNRAIVLAVAMDNELTETSPQEPASTTTSIGYSRMGITAVSLAEFIRSLGYTAIPCMNDTALSIPLAVDAGLGELGRNGLLITPEYGPNVRLFKVLTDMPLDTDKPVDFGISDFCRQCLLCAEHCPPEVISTGSQSFTGVCQNNNSGVKKWYINAGECLRFWQKNGTSCSNCIAVCPFTAGFQGSQCLECVRCDTTHGCSLHVITFMRTKHGYLKATSWGNKPVSTPLTRTGL
jgi:epoxyqueuosine reductase